MFGTWKFESWSLKVRVNVLKEVKSCRAVSSKVETIVKEREDILRRWERGKRSNKKYIMASYDDLEEHLSQ